MNKSNLVGVLLCVTVALACAGAALAQPQAVCVPWEPANPSIERYTYDGAEITLKGIARGDATEFRWDYGDGGSTDWTAIADPYNLGVAHTYTGVTGQLFIATLHVRDGSGNEDQDEYPIRIHESADLSDPIHLNVRINMAIDEGLWWLHTNMIRNTYSSGSPGYDQPYGYWDPGYYPLAATGTAVDAFQLHGSKVNTDYDSDPYVETVQRALNYILAHTYSYSIGSQPAGDPDANGNGIGLVANYTSNSHNLRQTYIGGICLVALASSGAPNRIASVGGNNVHDRTYADIVQDMVDFFAWGQVDSGSGRGGWRYYGNYSDSDMSTTQWPPLGMLAAEDNMGATVPQFVRDELIYFLNRTQHTSLDNDHGGFGYDNNWRYINITKTAAGLISHEFLGTPLTDSSVQSALGFIYRHWNDSGTSWGHTRLHGNSYGMYGVMKALRIPEPDITEIYDYDYSVGQQTASNFDWYFTPVGQTQQGLASYIVNTQQANGSWDDTVGPNAVYNAFCTGWRVLILLKGVTIIPPTAVICDCDEQEYNLDQDINLDGSCSFHPDITRQIVSYEWDYEYDGLNFQPEPNASGAQTTKTGGYHNAGFYRMALRVTDDNPDSLGGAQSNIYVCEAWVHPPPHCPHAFAGGPYIGWVDTPVTLDASASWDPDNEIASYEWDLDNDDVFGVDDDDCYGEADDATGEITQWEWDTPGLYVIGFKVTDIATVEYPDGCADIDYTTVDIGNHQPISDPGGPYIASPETTITLDGSGSYDPDPGDTIIFAWDLDNDGQHDDSNDIQPEFTVGTQIDREYRVCLRVTDNHGEYSRECTTVRIVEHDADADGIPDEIDNCPETPNTDQDDIDLDQEGDACDCDDNYMGPNEEAADCGEYCQAECPPGCSPVIYFGDSHQKIDIVFIPSQEYDSDSDGVLEEHGADQVTLFRDNIISAIANSYYSSPEIVNKKSAINFWYTKEVVAVGVNAAGQCGWDSANIRWREECPQSNAAAVMHIDAISHCRDGARGDMFSSGEVLFGVMLHEAGHGVFHLADEYSDWPECLTGYSETAPFANIYETRESCQANSSQPDECGLLPFTFCQDYWFKAQPDNTMMACCPDNPGQLGGSTCEWGPDAVRQVNNWLNMFYGQKFLGSDQEQNYMPHGLLATEEKAIICTLHYDGEIVELVDTTIIYGRSPNRYIDWDDLRMEIHDSTDAIAYAFTIKDPRYVDYAYPPGAELLSTTDFQIVLPFVDNTKILDVYDVTTNTPAGQIDLSPYIRNFCEAHPDDSQCISYDYDGDGVPDREDNCPDAANADQSDVDDDLYGDACDNCPEIANADQADIDADSDGDVCDNCISSFNPDQNDIDDDSHGDVCDNCPDMANPGQEDMDSDTFGDVCDTCPPVPNPDQEPDTTPPDISVAVMPNGLWPPNHRMVDIEAVVEASDICSTATIALEQITSSEPDDAPGIGDGATVNDIQEADYGTADYNFKLRAERAGTGSGRIYTVTYSATDASGNQNATVGIVLVAHNVNPHDPIEAVGQSSEGAEEISLTGGPSMDIGVSPRGSEESKEVERIQPQRPARSRDSAELGDRVPQDADALSAQASPRAQRIAERLAAIADNSAPAAVREAFIREVLSIVSATDELETRLRIVRALMGKVEASQNALLVERLEAIRAEAKERSREDLAEEAEQLLSELELAEE